MIDQINAGVGIQSYPALNADILSLKHIILFGMRGIAAYMDHTRILGKEDDTMYAFLHEWLAARTDVKMSMDEGLGLVRKCGEINLKTMELLDAAHTGTFGNPVPTKVPLGVKKGNSILVSGHDLKDLEVLLQQTEGMDIYIYTHGEMLPIHGYPGLKKYAHFYGHYGTAW